MQCSINFEATQKSATTQSIQCSYTPCDHQKLDDAIQTINIQLNLNPGTCHDALNNVVILLKSIRANTTHCETIKSTEIIKEYSQYSYYPIKYPHLNKYYEQQRDVFWTAPEVNHKGDREHWDLLDKPTRRFLKFVLCFFAQADGIINDNLINNFKRETSHYKEARHFYAMQEVIEVCHNEVYSNLIEAFIRDEKKKAKALDAITNYPSIKLIADTMNKWMDTSIPLLERLIAFSCVEGILFSSAFAAIYWIKRRNILLALCLANEWIARDEGIHTSFAVALYHTMVDDETLNYERISPTRIQEIVDDFVKVAETFNRDALRIDLLGMNADDMMSYVKSVADNLIEAYGCEKLYNAENKFGDWMANIGLPNKSNFFEKTVTEYGKDGKMNFEFDVNAEY